MRTSPFILGLTLGILDAGYFMNGVIKIEDASSETL